MMRSLWNILGGYGLACILLICLFVLTFFGTLYQVDHGLYDAKQVYFNSWFLKTDVGLPYFPGGVLVMLTLTLNLIVGGMIRIRWDKRRAGVLIVHVGIILMLVAGLVKLVNSEEGYLQLYEGQQSSQFLSSHLWEVSIWELTGPSELPQWVIGDDALTDLTRGRERTFHSGELPFKLVLSNYLPNCDALPKGPNWEASSKVIDGFALLERELEAEHERNLSGLTARIVTPEGDSQEALIWSRQEAPWVFEVAGRRFAIDLGRATYPMPFTIRLDKFTKEDHPGITMAKAFKSNVTKFDETGERPILIQMNEPLRDGGLVLFQSSYGPGTPGHQGPFYSVFSVVRNPSDKWPEYSMWIVTFGLLIIFGRHLLTFIRRQNAKRSQLAGEAS